MYYGFETSDEHTAIGALLVYGIYRSRDVKRFKVSPDMWGIIERAVKSCSKRAMDLNDFIEKLKPKLKCSTLKPKFMQTDLNTLAMHHNPETGEIIHIKDDGKREFWTRLLEECDHKTVLERLYGRTSLIIALVRDRLERERPLEIKGILKEDEEYIIDVE